MKEYNAVYTNKKDGIQCKVIYHDKKKDYNPSSYISSKSIMTKYLTKAD